MWTVVLRVALHWWILFCMFLHVIWVAHDRLATFGMRTTQINVLAIPSIWSTHNRKKFGATNVQMQKSLDEAHWLCVNTLSECILFAGCRWLANRSMCCTRRRSISAIWLTRTEDIHRHVNRMMHYYWSTADYGRLAGWLPAAAACLVWLVAMTCRLMVGWLAGWLADVLYTHVGILETIWLCVWCTSCEHIIVGSVAHGADSRPVHEASGPWPPTPPPGKGVTGLPWISRDSLATAADRSRQ